MKRRTVTSLVTIVAGWTAIPAYADTLRCGSSLISTGAQLSYVLDKCGQPDTTQEITEPVLAQRPNGTAYEVGTTTRLIWTYRRRSGEFPAVLTFEGGELKKLEFIK